MLVRLLNESRSIDTITKSEPVDGLPSNSEETVFISTEAESLFAGNEQVILQETPIVPHRRERLSYVNSTDMDSSLSSGLVSRIDSDTQAEETASMHRHGSSQTDSPNQQSQYTQTTVRPGFSYTDRARQAAARRRATSPFRRNYTSDNYNNQFPDHPISPISTVSSHYNQYTSGGLVPHYVLNTHRIRSRSAERDYNYGSRGVIVEEPHPQPSVAYGNTLEAKSESTRISTTTSGNFLYWVPTPQRLLIQVHAN